jgi:hypothetical protein
MSASITSSDPVLQRISALVAEWEQAHDRRSIFLGCYRLMTANMLVAIDEGRFHDGEWVSRLLHHFAQYYFNALELYDLHSGDTPQVWRLAHDATHQEKVMTLQHLMLGVNAHINYDLVFALHDLLAPEWAGLSADQRRQRFNDHTLVNKIIGETIDAVQDQVIDQHSPWYHLVDKLLGPTDEWLTSRLIAHWRNEVWTNAVQYVELRDRQARLAFQQKIEASAMRLGKDFLELTP